MKFWAKPVDFILNKCWEKRLEIIDIIHESVEILKPSDGSDNEMQKSLKTYEII